MANGVHGGQQRSLFQATTTTVANRQLAGWLAGWPIDEESLIFIATNRLLCVYLGSRGRTAACRTNNWKPLTLTNRFPI